MEESRDTEGASPFHQNPQSQRPSDAKSPVHMYSGPQQLFLGSEQTSPNSMYQRSPGHMSHMNYSPAGSPEPVPPGLDKDAFVAGERAAMARSIQMMLPSHQQLGMLGNGLQRLEYMVSEESNRMRQVQAANVEISTIAQSLKERLDRIEGVQLPEIERRVEKALDAPLAQEFQETLGTLSAAIQQVSKRQYIEHPSSFTGFMVRQLSCLGSAAVLYTQNALSKADVAALFLSRKILLEEKGQIQDITEVKEGSDQEGYQEKDRQSSSQFNKRLKAVSGSALFLVAVEIAWQLHQRALRVVPKPFRRFAAPAQLGLRVLRIATWVASLLMSAVLFRRGCHWIAQSSISQLTRIVQGISSYTLLKRPRSLTANESSPKSGEENENQADKELQTLLNEKLVEGSVEKQKWPYSEAIRIQATSQDGENPGKPLQRVRSIFDTPPPSP